MLKRLGIGALLLFTGCSALWSQALSTGSFLGMVKDSSGAAVPGALVRVAEENTQWRRDVSADAEGNYRVLEVPAGNYRIEFEKSGFSKTVVSDVKLSAGQSLRVDSVLSVGAVSESIQVNGKVAQVDTASANVGSTVFGTQVQELALNTRSFSQLMTLQPGVVSIQAQQPGFGSNTSVPFSFSGSQVNANNWLLDGGRNLDTNNGNNPSLVNLDAIAEVRIERNAYSAQYGRNGGGQVNVITRSGTNEYHGTLFEFFRNDKMDARNFFAATKPRNRYNNFGGTVGGAIKRDKVFFFLSNEYRRILQTAGTRTAIVPTTAQLSGDFNGVRTIKDPTTGQAFANNTIPASMLDPNALVLLKNYYPAPTPGFKQGSLNYTSSAPDGVHFRSGLARLDYNVSPTLTLFTRYNIDSTVLDSPFGLNATTPMPNVTSSVQGDIVYTWNASANWTIRPNLLNQFTVAFFHDSLAISTMPTASRTRFPGFNVPRVFNTVSASAGFIPTIVMSQSYAGIQILWPQNISSQSLEFRENVSYIKGRHIITFGGGMDKENKIQNNSRPNNNGEFTFNASATNDALADLLVGRAYQYTEKSNHVRGPVRFTNWALYIQDQFRVSSRLTLTYGVRWETFPPEYDDAGTSSFFDPSKFDASKAAVVQSDGTIVAGTQNYGNGMVVVGKGAKYGEAMTNSVYNTFDPRVGFSYSLTRNNLTVLRGGYGIFHDRWPQLASSAHNNYPLNQTISIYNTLFSNPAQGAYRYFPIDISNYNSPWEIPSLQKWSLGVQRQLPAELLLEVGYVGSKGTHLIRAVDRNQPVASSTVASGQASPNSVRPYRGFAGISTQETTADTSYHSLQTSLVRRFSAGISFQGSYTFGKSLDNVVTPINAYASNRVERAMATFDRTHVLAASYVWDMPFARKLHGWKKSVLDGWQISGITRMESGLPLTITIPSDRAGVGASSQRPNISGEITRVKTLTQWFTTSAFSLPALGTFGNAGRSLVRGPGGNNWDLAFCKRTMLHERVGLQFRAEFFNIFNHTQYSGVGTSFGSSTLGLVTSARDPRITQLALRLLF